MLLTKNELTEYKKGIWSRQLGPDKRHTVRRVEEVQTPERNNNCTPGIVVSTKAGYSFRKIVLTKILAFCIRRIHTDIGSR